MRHAVRDASKLQGLPSGRVLIGLLATGVGLSLIIALNRAKPAGPDLATSCTTPAIAVKSFATPGGKSFRYAFTGPKTGTYVVALDAHTAVVRGDGADVSPPGAIAVAVTRGLANCKRAGSLPTLAGGPHQVVLFRDGRIVATGRLTSG